ncbi:MAG TPA: septal ring lytic transglycosylase RlpA family protein [Terriglobia bacterium]
MRRLAFVIASLVFLSACGHKNVRVKAPQPGSISPSELEGLASYYAEPYNGRKTANGEIFDTYQQLTAAHRTLPFNTMVRVTNKTNGRQVDVRINDRGPFVKGRVIDLSLLAAKQIDLVGPGIAPVKLIVLKEGEFAKAPIPPAPFAVQVAAFENQKKAEELAKKLEKKYMGVTVQPTSADKVLYRVRIGEPDMETANKIVAELRSHDLKPFVVRLATED